MLKIPNNKKLVNMLTVLTVAGEMPLVAASQAGSHEGYRKLFYELSKKQVFINIKTNEQMRVKLIHMSDRGDKRRCRLYKNAIPILDWIGTRAYYEEMFPDNKMSGGEQNRFRNAMVAEAVLMMLERAGSQQDMGMAPEHISRRGTIMENFSKTSSRQASPCSLSRTNIS